MSDIYNALGAYQNTEDTEKRRAPKPQNDTLDPTEKYLTDRDTGKFQAPKFEEKPQRREQLTKFLKEFWGYSDEQAAAAVEAIEKIMNDNKLKKAPPAMDWPEGFEGS